MFIVYASSSLMLKENLKLMEEIKEWAKEEKVVSFTALTKTPGILKNYGFKEDGFIQMRMEI